MTIIDNFSLLLNAEHGPRPARVLLRRARRFINSVVAAIIAHRQRQADIAALWHLDDRELKDIGLYPSQIEHGLNEAARLRTQRQIAHRV